MLPLYNGFRYLQNVFYFLFKNFPADRADLKSAENRRTKCKNQEPLRTNYPLSSFHSPLLVSSSIKISSNLIAASLILVPGPKTATAPASKRNW